MEKMIPYEKMNKKQKKEYNKKKRNDWGNVHPSTKPFKSDYKKKKEEMRGIE